jgi:serine/threonine protein kinase
MTASEAGWQHGAMGALAYGRVGSILAERWTLLDVLGIGGTACVYRARHRNGGGVAIKVLHPEYARAAQARRRFLSEGRAANRLSHSGAVAILDDGEEPDGTTFLVMELLSGTSLDHHLAVHGTLAWRAVTDIGIQVLDVLAAAHDKSVLHRDVKPSNVFLTEGGAVKLLDFGAAKVRDWESTQHLTCSGTTIGTPAFMAPELAAGLIDEVDASSDVWAVGATMFQLLSGRTVHEARSANEAIVAAATRPAPPLRTVCADLPPALTHVVDRALAYDKAARWPNARAMQAALRQIVGGVVVAGGPTTAPEIARSGRLKSRLQPRVLWSTAIAVALAVLWMVVARPKLNPAIAAPAASPPSVILPPAVAPAPAVDMKPPDEKPPDLVQPRRRPRKPAPANPDVLLDRWP